MHRKKAIPSFFEAPSDLSLLKSHLICLLKFEKFSKFPKLTEIKCFGPDILEIDLFYSLCENNTE